MIRISVALASVAVICSGCGGGSADGASAVSAGSIGPSTVGATFNETTGLFNFTAEGSALAMSRQSSHGHGDFDHYHASAPEARAYGGQTENSIVAVVASDSSTLTPYAGTSFENLTATEIRTTGSASFQGDYVAFLRKINGTDAFIVRLINGDATINANFGAGAEISGTVTNRQAHQPVTNAPDSSLQFGTLTLNSTSLAANGSFTGSAVGGEIQGQGWQVGSGSYAGQLTGPLGNEAAGGTIVTHISPASETFQEIGGFIAKQ